MDDNEMNDVELDECIELLVKMSHEIARNGRDMSALLLSPGHLRRFLDLTAPLIATDEDIDNKLMLQVAAARLAATAMIGFYITMDEGTDELLKQFPKATDGFDEYRTRREAT